MCGTMYWEWCPPMHCSVHHNAILCVCVVVRTFSLWRLDSPFIMNGPPQCNTHAIVHINTCALTNGVSSVGAMCAVHSVPGVQQLGNAVPQQRSIQLVWVSRSSGMFRQSPNLLKLFHRETDKTQLPIINGRGIPCPTSCPCIILIVLVPHR